MTTEHVSVPRKIVEAVWQSLSCLGDTKRAEQLFAILSRATPSAPRVVSDDDVERALKAFNESRNYRGEVIGASMRAALESLPAVRVPDAKLIELANTLEKFVPSGGPGPLWCAGASFAYNDVAKTIRAMLAATPNPNDAKEEE